VLKSTLPVEEGGAGEPSPFILEPPTMELDKDNTQNLTIWAFPEEARAYKDEIVCLLKDNPNPVIFPILALGAQPVVEVDQEVVEFDRLLLGKTLQKTLTLTNVAAIPANWQLTGVDELPEEFKVSVTSGRLAPCAVQTIEITFEAKEEKILDPIINLEVEDVEECGVKQEVKPIKLQAEAFKISPNVVVGKDDSQILDFGAVRVGEPKEQSVTIKNDGKYPIRYSFLRKKKLYREIFKVEPEEDELQPGVEKTIVVRLLTQKEIKLRTEKQASELQLNILEGASQEINNEIPIHVNVNAVFAKYSITPLKNINFGPMQYGRTEPRRFEVRNEGLFEFKYAIVDFAD
jgi:hydrocephalus-inducing protein